MPKRPIAVAGPLLVLLAAPAAAEAAPAMEPLKPCYVSAGEDERQREPISVGLSGFTPNSLVNVALDGADVVTNVQTDPNGAISGSVPAPHLRSGQRDFTVTATEVNNSANTVSATSRVTALTVSIKPRRARPTSKVRFRGAGFTGGGPVYAHYVFKNRLRKTVQLGRPDGVCGLFSARKRQIPVRARTGLWTVQFDQTKEFAGLTTPPPGVYVQLNINVFRTISPG